MIKSKIDCQSEKEGITKKVEEKQKRKGKRNIQREMIEERRKNRIVRYKRNEKVE